MTADKARAAEDRDERRKVGQGHGAAPEKPECRCETVLKLCQGESKMAFFEHRSGAYTMYESIGAPKNAICRQPSRSFRTVSEAYIAQTTPEVKAYQSAPNVAATGTCRRDSNALDDHHFGIRAFLADG